MTDAPASATDVDLELLHDLLFGLRLECADSGSRVPDRYKTAQDVPVMLDAPFGPAGPMVLRFGDVLSLLFGWSTIQSAMRLSKPDHLLFDYTRLMMGFRLFLSDPTRIEMIGLGGGSLAKACYRYLPNTDITVIEIDPQVIGLREQFDIPPDDHRFRVICTDGVDYVATAPESPDVLLIDGFDKTGLPPALSEQAFYDSCRARLGSHGLLVANLCDNARAFPTLVRRIAASFDGRAIAIPAEQRGNRVVFACADAAFPPTFDAVRLAAQNLPSRDPIDYSIKLRRIMPALRRWPALHVSPATSL